MKRFILIIAFLTCSLKSVFSEEPVFPRPTGTVNDFAGILTPVHVRQLTTLISELEEKTGAQIAIATLETTEPLPIDEYAVNLFSQWGVGEKGKDNGILIVVAVKDRKVWIEVGYGLEGVVPDAFASEVYREELVPAFRREEYGEGLYHAILRLADRVAEEAGTSLSKVDRLKPKVESRENDFSQYFPLLILFILFFIPFIRSLNRSQRTRSRRSPFWGLLLGLPYRGGYWSSGGVSGGLGGFGGGFGGFGGGSTGGGGAGGGW